MEHYEVAMLLSPDFSDKDVERFAQETKEMLSKFGATDIGEEKIERRAFAYPVKKHNEGFYVFIGFNGPPNLPGEVRTELRHREGLLRLAFIRKPETPAEPELSVEPEPTAEPQTEPAAEAPPAPVDELQPEVKND